jgi:gamma-glutamylcyclotransferase (GGCT)/AIG2-like uncharacterized protein YtfP
MLKRRITMKVIEEKEMITKVFVYGTLKEGGRLDREELAELRTSVEVATIEAGLFSLGRYPTVKLDEDGITVGEVHTFKSEDFEGVQELMDMIEGYRHKTPKEGLFNRHKIEATLEEGEVVTVWVYEYNRPIDPDEKVEDGIWR